MNSGLERHAIIVPFVRDWIYIFGEKLAVFANAEEISTNVATMLRLDGRNSKFWVKRDRSQHVSDL